VFIDSSDVITEVTLDAISLVEEPAFVTPFATHDEAGDMKGKTGKYNFLKM